METGRCIRQKKHPFLIRKEMFEKFLLHLMFWLDENDKAKKLLLLSQKIKSNRENNKDILCIFSLRENNKLIKP